MDTRDEVVSGRAMKVYSGIGGMAPLVFNLCVRLIATRPLDPLTPKERTPGAY